MKVFNRLAQKYKLTKYLKRWYICKLNNGNDLRILVYPMDNPERFTWFRIYYSNGLKYQWNYRTRTSRYYDKGWERLSRKEFRKKMKEHLLKEEFEKLVNEDCLDG